jgi:hypothetical protein
MCRACPCGRRSYLFASIVELLCINGKRADCSSALHWRLIAGTIADSVFVKITKNGRANRNDIGGRAIGRI